MATSLDKQLDRIEKADAAARKVHSVVIELGETNEEARAGYEVEHGAIADGDFIAFIRRHFPDEAEGSVAAPKILGVQRRRAKPPAPAKPQPRQWGGTTCVGPNVYPGEHADEKRDPYRSDWKKPLRYPDIYPSPDAGAADERALRTYAVKLSRRSSL